MMTYGGLEGQGQCAITMIIVEMIVVVIANDGNHNNKDGGADYEMFTQQDNDWRKVHNHNNHYKVSRRDGPPSQW